MATYVGFARSSYAKVKDPQAFEEFCRRWGVEMIDGIHTLPDGVQEKVYGFLCRLDSGLPNYPVEDEENEADFADFLAELSEHLAEGWAFEVREIGYEAMRYLVGVTHIVLWTGDVYTLSLDEAYVLAKEKLGKDFQITHPSY